MNQRYVYIMLFAGFWVLSSYSAEETAGEPAGKVSQEAREIARELTNYMRELNRTSPGAIDQLKSNKEAYRKFVLEQMKEIQKKREHCEGIMRYSEKRDKDALLQIYADNWYWLVADGVDFDPENFLSTGNRSLDGKNRKDAKILVYCRGGKPIAFVAYHLTSYPQIGAIRILGNNKDTEDYEYVEKLLQFALDDLEKMGAKIVDLSTRLDNARDLAVYEKLGFIQGGTYGDDDEDGEHKYVELTKPFLPSKSRVKSLSEPFEKDIL